MIVFDNYYKNEEKAIRSTSLYMQCTLNRMDRNKDSLLARQSCSEFEAVTTESKS